VAHIDLQVVLIPSICSIGKKKRIKTGFYVVSASLLMSLKLLVAVFQLMHAGA